MVCAAHTQTPAEVNENFVKTAQGQTLHNIRHSWSFLGARIGIQDSVHPTDLPDYCSLSFLLTSSFSIPATVQIWVGAQRVMPLSVWLF